jgi:hypothetical protein
MLTQSKNLADHAADPITGHGVADRARRDRETEAGVRERVRANGSLEECLGAPLAAPVDMFKLRLVAETLTGRECEGGDSLASGARLKE